MKYKQFFLFISLSFSIFSAYAQTFIELNNTYAVKAEGSKAVVSGFAPFTLQKDNEIFANTLLWVVENVCPVLRDGVTDGNISNKSFKCNLILESMAGSGLKNTYQCNCLFRVAEGKLIYYISDIQIESKSILSKKVTPLESLNPEKKKAHKETISDFEKSESYVLNTLFDFIATNKLPTISHWKEISFCRPVKGMNDVECKLAFGKPQTILETNGEVQWMYSSSFYIFMRDNIVQTIIK